MINQLVKREKNFESHKGKQAGSSKRKTFDTGSHKFSFVVTLTILDSLEEKFLGLPNLNRLTWLNYDVKNVLVQFRSSSSSKMLNNLIIDYSTSIIISLSSVLKLKNIALWSLSPGPFALAQAKEQINISKTIWFTSHLPLTTNIKTQKRKRGEKMFCSSAWWSTQDTTRTTFCWC